MMNNKLKLFITLFVLIGIVGCADRQSNRSTGEVIDDAVITSTVKTELLADSDVGGLDIDVDTTNGVVTLSGTVSSEMESQKAEEIAGRANGVVSVNNKLIVVSDIEINDDNKQY
ncbi:MAG: BON domain-containing protein [Deltaproteobacteria bacterium]